MATSKLTLYLQSGMKPENNYIVEDIREYLRLNAESTLVRENFQYIKNPAKSQQFKVNIAQSAYNEAVFDYASLEQDGDTYYYFIVDATWKSQNCLGFTAVLDTLNTFQDQYGFTDRSNIERQHVDRFKLIGARPTGDSIDEVVTNVISDTKEELQPELLMTRKEVLGGDLPIDSKYQWYLIYQTNSSSGYPQVMLCADKDIKAGTVTGPDTLVLTANDLKTGYPCRMVFGKFRIVINTDESETIDMDGQLAITPDGDNLRFSYIPYYDFSTYTMERRTGRIKIELADSTSLYVYKTNSPNFNEDLVKRTAESTLIGNALITNIDTIDRTRSNLYRIIECPYCPLQLDIQGDVLKSIPAQWEYDQGQNKLVCNDLRYEFPERTVWTEENVMNLIAGQVIKAQRSKLTLYSRHDHSDGVEGNVVDPKSYISSLKSYNFVYDTASWSVIPEDLVIPNKTPRPDLIQIKFKQSNNISSDCGFRFDIPEFGKMHREYFDDYMFSMRSNELPLFSSDYINYINNGYNYDKKANSLKMWSDIVGIGTGVLGAGGNLLSGIIGSGIKRGNINRSYNARLRHLNNAWADDASLYPDGEIDYATENFYFTQRERLLSKQVRDLSQVKSISDYAVPAIVSGAVGSIAGAFNTALSHFQRENALEQKINEYKNRAFSVSTTGNHDLFKWYSGNKLILFEFEPREEVRELINDYFSLYGYSRGYYEKPDLDSRLFFNYCRGYVDIDNYKKRRAIEENKADIVQKFQDGVYKIHKVNTPLGAYWDMKLERQNYERSILPIEWCE